jgi:ABC-type polysaccharide/polyol phosphate transport system ATPase subunit
MWSRVSDEDVSGDVVLGVSHVSKRFCHDLRRSLGHGVRDVARELLRRPPREGLRRDEFWALDDVSFELRRGEALAVVGRNGAGKTTLLKLLYGLFKPDLGEIRIRGQTAAIIELGTGFDAALTGRENIALAAAVHGHPPRETAGLLDEVVDFAELEEAIDAPVQSYSTGMKARLGYALCAHLRPDVLLVDEALAVGDIAFQRKCVNHMRSYLSGGGALIFVSHNAFQAQVVAERGLLIERGRLAFDGPTVEAIDRLFKLSFADAPSLPAGAPPDGPVAIEGLTAEPVDGDAIETGRPLRLRLRYRSSERREAIWSFTVWTADQWVCVTGASNPHVQVLEPGPGELTCVIPDIPLVAGRYCLRGSVVDPETRIPWVHWGWENQPTSFVVEAPVSADTNVRKALQQLMTVDVAWE